MSRKLLRMATELSSRKFISRLTGRLTKSSWSKRWIPHFVRIFEVKVEEAEKKVEEYRSLNDFFTRRLKPGTRPICQGENLLLSPVDAKIISYGKVTNGQMLHVKGQDYSIEDLLLDSPYKGKYIKGHYWILYLSPSDYHRIHSPCKGTIVESKHIPGKVYPVNQIGLTLIPRVLNQNERLITFIRSKWGQVALVKVGAFNVSSIHYVDPHPQKMDPGEELAYFEFGSTVVLLTQEGICEPNLNWEVGDKVQVGQRLGTFIGNNA